MTTYELYILKNALLNVERKEVSKFKLLSDEKIEFSETFERKIKKLAEDRKKFVWQATKTLPRRILASVLVAIITFCLMMTISAIRIPIINFFANVYEEFIEIFVEEDEEIIAPDSIENVYSPSYIMEDYFEISYTNDELQVETIWMDSVGNIFILEQDIIESVTNIDNKDLDYSKTIIDSMDVYYTSKNGQRLFIWTNNYYMFRIICSEQLEFPEIEKFISNLTISN